jgi:glycosyltransferase involved in cell wall biosynthesis
MAETNPDIVVLFSDPRFFQYVFVMDNEIRDKSKIVLYHTWDNDPFPSFNLPWYAACDHLVMISKFSQTLFTQNSVECNHIPHGIDTDEFIPLDQETVDKELEHIKHLMNKKNINFTVFWNNRNIFRKRPGDVIKIFEKFNQRHPDSILLMNTDAVDMQGTDIPYLIDRITSNLPVLLNFEKLQTQHMNVFYNIADVTLNIAYNEGFGLCVAESLSAGTPVIATRTGGMPEQLTGEDGSVFGKLLDPSVRHLFGVPGAPFMYQDFVNNDIVLDALEWAYQKKKSGELKSLGLAGRDHIIKNFNTTSVIDMWDKELQRIHSTPSLYRSWQYVTL